MIPYGKQDIRPEDIEAVVEVLKSDFLTQGPVVGNFETAVAANTEASCAVACNSATSALHIAVSALGLGPGDVLWTSPISFVASANVARFNGADVDFVDIDPGTFNMCPDKLADKLEVADAANKLPKIIMPVHMCGQSPDMSQIKALADRYGIFVVEDASHAIGAAYDGHPVGSCRHSDICVFSFHPVKIITTGEGGIATTNDQNLADRMRRIHTHGITRDEALMAGETHGPWYYQQLELGWNYRMTELQAALGLSQLHRLSEYVDRRNMLAEAYDAKLAGLPLDLPDRLAGSRSSWHLYVVQLLEAADRRRVFEGLRARGIGVNIHYIPIHSQPYYKALGFADGDFPASEDYYSRAISIPVHPGMTEADQTAVIDALEAELS